MPLQLAEAAMEAALNRGAAPSLGEPQEWQGAEIAAFLSLSLGTAQATANMNVRIAVPD